MFGNLSPVSSVAAASPGVSPLLAGAPSAHQRTLVVHPLLAPVLPHHALQRGNIIACGGPAAISLSLLAVVEASRAGSWVAAAGMPALGLAAAAEMGVALTRLIAVDEPSSSPFGEQVWGDVLAAMIDGFDMVLVGSSCSRRLRTATVRKLQARVQSRGAVLVLVGHAGGFSADVDISSGACQWQGLGQGHGRGIARTVDVQVSGRRVPRQRWASLLLPGADGGPAASDSSDPGSVVHPVLHDPVELRPVG